MIYTWKHMMLDLHVQSPAEEIAPPALGTKILSSNNLVFQEILIFRMGSVFGKVINLRVDHEVPREKRDRGKGPD